MQGTCLQRAFEKADCKSILRQEFSITGLSHAASDTGVAVRLSPPNVIDLHLRVALFRETSDRRRQSADALLFSAIRCEFGSGYILGIAHS